MPTITIFFYHLKDYNTFLWHQRMRRNETVNYRGKAKMVLDHFHNSLSHPVPSFLFFRAVILPNGLSGFHSPFWVVFIFCDRFCIDTLLFLRVVSFQNSKNDQNLTLFRVVQTISKCWNRFNLWNGNYGHISYLHLVI